MAPARLRSSGALVVAIVLAASLTGCISAKRTPNLQRIFQEARARTGKRPIIVIPGILGSQLVNTRTGEVVWPSVLRSSAEQLPITPDLANNRDDLVADKI